jgi:hypothetical protein
MPVYSLVAEAGVFAHTGNDTGFTVAALPPLIKDISFVASITLSSSGSNIFSSSNFAALNFVASDLAVVFCESSQTVTAPPGWVEIPGCPLAGTGTTLYGFCRFYGPWVSSNQTFTGTNHQTSVLSVFRNIDTQTPFGGYATATEATVTTAMSWPGITTTRDKSWVVYAAARAQQGVSSGQQSALTLPTGVTGAVERFDTGNQSGDGGGVAVVTSYAATAGAFGSATATLTTASEQALLTLALNPQQYTGLVLNATSGVELTQRTSGTVSTVSNVRHLNGAYYALANAASNSQKSTDGITWTSISFGSSIGTDMEFGGGVYVATVSNNTGVVYTSTDGTSFVSANHNQAAAMNSVCYGGGQFVIVGASGKIATSPDGTTWTGQTSGVTSTLNSVIWDGKQFVSVGASGVVLTSPDGVAWTRQNNVPSYSNTIASVAFGNGVYVAKLNGSLTAWGSTDSINWVFFAAPAFASTGATQRVNWTGSQFVLTTTSGGLATSTDGYVWTVISTGTTTNLTGSAVNGDQMVLVGASGSIWTTPVPSPSQASVQSSLDSGPRVNRLYAGKGLSGLSRAYNSNSSPTLAKAASNGTGVWVVPRNTASTGYEVSTDGGKTFVSATASVSATRKASAYGAGVFVFVGTSGFIESSPSGLTGTWTTCTSGTTNAFNDLIYANGQFVAVGAGGSVCVSTDGSTWNHNLTGFGTGLQSVIWDGTQYMASSSSSYATYVSADGVTWTAGSNIFSASSVYYNLSYGNGVYIAAPLNSNGIRYSTDGSTWNFAVLPDTLTSLGYGVFTGKKHIIPRNSSAGIIYTTEDGINFAQYVVSNVGAFTAAATDGNGNILLTASFGVIWTAKDEAFQSEFKFVGHDAFFTNVVSYQFAAEQGAYLASGLDSNLLFSRWLTSEQGSYTQTNPAATLSYGRSLPAAQASFTFTGLAAGVYHDKVVLTGSAAFTADGVAAGLVGGFGLVANSGACNTTGVAAQTLWGRQITGGTVACAWVSADSGLLAGRMLPGAVAGCALTLTDAALLSGRQVTTSTQTVGAVTVAAGLTCGRWLGVANGSFASTWFDAGLATGFGLVANPGMFSLTAADVQWAWNRVLTGQAVSFNHAVYQASLLATRQLPAAPTSLAADFKPGTLAYGRVVVASTSWYSLEAVDLRFLRAYTAMADTGSYTLTGFGSQANKTLFFGVQPGLFQILGYSSKPFFSALTPAKDVAIRAQELRSTLRPHESNVTIRRADGSVAVRPTEDVSSFVVPHDTAHRGEENRTTYH